MNLFSDNTRCNCFDHTLQELRALDQSDACTFNVECFSSECVLMMCFVCNADAFGDEEYIGECIGDVLDRHRLWNGYQFIVMCVYGRVTNDKSTVSFHDNLYGIAFGLLHPFKGSFTPRLFEIFGMWIDFETTIEEKISHMLICDLLKEAAVHGATYYDTSERVSKHEKLRLIWKATEEKDSKLVLKKGHS